MSCFPQVTGIDTGAGAVVFDKPVTIGFVVKDRLVPCVLCINLIRNSCEQYLIMTSLTCFAERVQSVTIPASTPSTVCAMTAPKAS